MVANLQAKTHLLDLACFGSALVFLSLFGLLVVVFAPIDNFTNRGVGIWRNLYKIQLGSFCGIYRLAATKNAKLTSVFTYDTQKWRANRLVYAGVFVNCSVLASYLLIVIITEMDLGCNSLGTNFLRFISLSNFISALGLSAPSFATLLSYVDKKVGKETTHTPSFLTYLNCSNDKSSSLPTTSSQQGRKAGLSFSW